MAGAGILPLITAPVIANMRLHHVLIDGGASLNVISHAAFKQLQIPGFRLGPSRPFSGVGPQPVYPLGSIALSVTFGAEENFRTENVVFDVAKVNLPFNGHHWQAGPVPVHSHCPLRVFGPQDAIPDWGPHRAG
jgi:hypothetical protein